MQQAQEQDLEIDLRKYIQIMIKRKMIILGALFIFVFLGAVRTLRLPKIYEVSMIIEPPMTAIMDTGVQSFDSVANIKALIESGAVNSKIIDELNLPETELHFNINLPKDTRLIKVSLNEPADKTDMGKKIMSKLLEKLTLSYAKIIDDKRNRIDNQIKMILSQIEKKENEIRLKNDQFKIYEERERQFAEEIKESKANSEKLLAKREAVLERKENKDDTAALFYAVTIQQNMNYFTQLQNDLSDLKTKKANVLGAVDGLKNDISASRIEIGNQNLLKGGVQNISVIQEPYVSHWPVGPKRRQNILIAGISGLVVGLAAAFAIDWWGNSSSPA